MKKVLLITASALMIAALMAVTILGASAAVYIQDGKFKYQIFNDGTAAFAGYISDTVDDVTIPRYYDTHDIISVANFALENNSKVRTIDFMEAPDIEKIGMYAFHNCSSLESVLVPSSITTVGVSAFRDCASLTDVTFYGNNNAVPAECFYNCTALKNVRLSVNLKMIQSYAFAGCSSLEYVELFDSVTYIAPNAFDGADNVTLGVFYGTYAHQYAMDNNISYVLLDSVMLGDADGDCYVSISDVTAIQRHVAEFYTLEDSFLSAADVNSDGVVDILDATEIQRYLAEYEVDYPIGEVVSL